MRKLLALLLAMILPLCAFAETHCLSIETAADEASFPQVAATLLRGLGLTEDELTPLAQMFQAILQNAALKITTQDDATQLEIRLSGGVLLDVTLHEVKGESWLTSTLIPGHALVGESSVQPANSSESSAEEIFADIAAACTAWIADLSPETTRGAYEGDAYQGGTQCTTWTVTDQDIAAFASKLLTEDARAQLDSTDASELLPFIDEANARVARENRHMYILRAVRDDADTLVGLSLTVMGDVEQLATVSVGIGEKELRVVVGLGLSGENYWGECVLQVNRRDQLTFLKGTCREWTADKFSTFAYVSQTAAPVAACNWSCNISRMGSRYLWDGSLYSGETPDAANALCSFNGSLNLATNAVETAIKFLPGMETPLKVSISFEPAEAIPPVDSALTPVSATDPTQAESYLQLMQDLYTEVSLRLMQLLPLDELLPFGEWFQ